MRSIPLCTERDCPAKSDPDFHIPFCGHGLAYDHHHVVKRSQGGKGGDVVCLCPSCHRKADEHVYRNAIVEVDGARVYRLWNEKGELIAERTLGLVAACV